MMSLPYVTEFHEDTFGDPVRSLGVATVSGTN